MKLVTAIIKPFKLEDVRDALTRWGSRGLRGGGQGLRRQKGHTEIYRGAEYTVNFLPKIRSRWCGRRARRALSSRRLRPPQDGQIGDGKIFVIEVEHALRSAPAKPIPTRCNSFRPGDTP